MPKLLTQYRVFIASPRRLDDERKHFRDLLWKYTVSDAEPGGVIFHPVGWEDTIGGVGRPQELINEDFSQCDYAVFVLFDRWGSPTGRTFPGSNSARFSNSRSRSEAEKKYLFKNYAEMDDFHDTLGLHLARWLRDHERASKDASLDDDAPAAPSAMVDGTTLKRTLPLPPGFDYWSAEANKLLEREPAEQALARANSDTEWAEGKYLVGAAQIRLNKLSEAVAALTEIVEVCWRRRYSFGNQMRSQ